MKKYDLTCLKCQECGDIYAKLDDPATLFCASCDENFHIDDFRETIEEWVRYIADYDAMLKGKPAPGGNEKRERYIEKLEKQVERQTTELAKLYDDEKILLICVYCQGKVRSGVVCDCTETRP